MLEQERVRPRAVVGCSMGALVGAMVLAHGSAGAAVGRWREAIERRLVPPVPPLRRLAAVHEHPLAQIARRVRNRIVVAMAVNRQTVLDGTALVRAVDFLLPDLDIAALPGPFVAVATDLATGEEVRLCGGSLRRAVAASCAIPGLLPAREVDGRCLLDGGVVAEVPVAAARDLGWPVLAVDASLDLPPVTDDDLVLDTLMRAQLIGGALLRARQLAAATWVVRPRVGHATWADWDRFEELVEAGRAAARLWLGGGREP